MSEKHLIPKHLDEPFKLILWTVDELIALFTPVLVLTFFFNSPIVGCVIGAVALFALKKIKGEQGHYFLYNVIYWYLPPLVFFKKIPPSYIREWQG